MPLVELPVDWSPDCMPVLPEVPEVPPVAPLWLEVEPLWPELPLWSDVPLDCAWTVMALNIAATTEAPNRPFNNLFIFMPISY